MGSSAEDESHVDGREAEEEPSGEEEPPTLTSCDFNQGTSPFCHFTQDSSDNSDWTRHKGPTPTTGTGPNGDYPDGSQ
ncbi:hypothetical protein CRUP_013670 [Coryphaenoides rupestris]|nr:hypothetical protein CRUP_013670 [Coryphaenoides rupestris]